MYERGAPLCNGKALKYKQIRISGNLHIQQNKQAQEHK